jgi:murein DD-endopeptidase MepM/ murein hydrolase activator NlpD
LLLILGAVAALWVGFSMGPEPELSLTSGFDAADEVPLLGPRNTLLATALESERGIGQVLVEFEQEGQTRTLGQATHAFRSPWKPWAAPDQVQVQLSVDINRETVPNLREGAAVVRLTARRSSGFLRFPEPVVLERSFTVRMKSPSLEVLSTTHYITQGGAEVVVYQVGETASSSGVRVNDWFFPGYPLPGGGPQERFALYAVPYDRSELGDLRLVAEDQVANRSEKRFVDRFFPKPLGKDNIQLSDRFLEKVVPDILSQTPELQPDDNLLAGYLAINRELRQMNRAELRELAAETRQEFLWSGPFLPLRNAKATASFSQRRTYMYEGKPVDTQDHLGFDLASVARAPVQAANDGVVLRAGWFGIYGNAVVLDHGYGLLSLYGHLSSISVQEGEEVIRGQELGRTGETGLAGGDHLHFAILLQGLPVNPVEWWDDHWIEDRLRLKLGDAFSG